MERNLQRLAVLALLACVLWLAGIAAEDTWVLWCVPLLVMAAEHLAYIMGVAQGFEIYHRMTPQQRADVARILDAEDTQ